MSITPISQRNAFFAVVVMLVSFVSAAAQGIAARLEIESFAPAVLKVSGRFPEPTRSFSFETESAGTKGLEDRISSVDLRDEAGASVAFRREDSGSVFAEKPVVSFRYSVSVDPPADSLQGAHVSWLSGKTAVLFLEDLLPALTSGPQPASVGFAIPQGWSLAAPVGISNSGSFEVPDLRDAVFLLSGSARESTLNEWGASVQIVVGGTWQFEDSDVARLTKELLNHYRELFGSAPSKLIRIVLLRAPDEDLIDRWSAETRGNTVVIVSSPSRYRNKGLQRLSEQLRHELLHLWMPNAAGLSGDYAWFYEGFAVYEALKTGAVLGQIRFEDLLSTLTEANRRSTLGGMGTERKSLIDLGKERFEGMGVRFYSRAMLVAFLCDIEMLNASRGKQGAETLLRELFEAGRKDPPKDGTAEALRVMVGHSELRSIVERYIEGAEVPDWSKTIGLAGLVEEPVRGGGRLKVSAKPDGRRKAILKRLGYNTDR